MAEAQRQQRADAGRRQGRENCQRVDEAFIEDAEDDVDDDQRGADQRRLAAQRGLERLRVALEGRDDRGRHADLARRLVDRIDGLAERDAGFQIERDGHRGELALMGNQKRPDAVAVDSDEGGQRHRGAGQRRFHVEAVERREVLLQFGQDFQHHEIGFELGEILRDLALAESVVQGVVDRLRRDAEARRLVAVDRDLQPRPVGQQVRGDVGELRHGAQLLQELLRPLVQLGDIRVLQGVLEAAAGDAGADIDVLGRLQEQIDGLDFRQLRPQPVDDLRGGEFALVARLEHDEIASGIGRLRAAGGAGKRAETLDVGIGQDDVADGVHQPHHLFRRGFLRGFGESLDQAGVLDRKKALRDHDRHDQRQRHGGEEDAERDRLVTQHDVERAPVEVEHGVEAALDRAIDAAVASPARAS